MVKETAFADPPRGHHAVLVYDAVNDQWVAQRATLFTFDDTADERATAGSGAGGNTTVNTTAVPAGVIHVYTTIHAWHDDGTARDMELYKVTAAGAIEMVAAGSRTRYNGLNLVSPVYCKEGEYVRAVAFSVAASKTVYLTVLGYSMVVPS
jgi:hypothetical protein